MLPAQYSHCWQISGAGVGSLFRADLMQLGVRFSGQLKAELGLVFGQLWNSGCRQENADDMERLKIRAARKK